MRAGASRICCILDAKTWLEERNCAAFQHLEEVLFLRPRCMNGHKAVSKGTLCLATRVHQHACNSPGEEGARTLGWAWEGRDVLMWPVSVASPAPGSSVCPPRKTCLFPRWLNAWSGAPPSTLGCPPKSAQSQALRVSNTGVQGRRGDGEAQDVLRPPPNTPVTSTSQC